MLRADPDVIMVGEIRDRETAHIAVEAALTGHMVLSTLHTRDAPSALGRLIDMGIEPFLISSAVDCVVAQRLVRKLCPHCKRLATLPESVLEEYGLDEQPYAPAGCSRCSGSGYRGRVGLYEVMTDQRRDPHPGAAARFGRRDRRHRRPRGDAPPARRRHRQGPRRPHFDRGSRAHDQQPRLIPPATLAHPGGPRVRAALQRPAGRPAAREGAQLAANSSEMRSGPEGKALAMNEYAW